ncbi:hypothetical protein AAMO2058_000818200 [Amorphochlora amoebiformis]|mmetsp:Transcript_6566/g.10115  ORF Transcript_6566/g.10115 Transcript_6566/m.10115 type:complete len:252 (-) Transcript_6566:9-764(-)
MDSGDMAAVGLISAILCVQTPHWSQGTPLRRVGIKLRSRDTCVGCWGGGPWEQLVETSNSDRENSDDDPRIQQKLLQIERVRKKGKEWRELSEEIINKLTQAAEKALLILPSPQRDEEWLEEIAVYEFFHEIEEPLTVNEVRYVMKVLGDPERNLLSTMVLSSALAELRVRDIKLTGGNIDRTIQQSDTDSIPVPYLMGTPYAPRASLTGRGIKDDDYQEQIAPAPRPPLVERDMLQRFADLWESDNDNDR